MSSPIDFPEADSLERSAVIEGYKGRSAISPLLHYLNGRPVSLHVRGGERSGDNTRVRRRTAKRMAFVGR